LPLRRRYIYFPKPQSCEPFIRNVAQVVNAVCRPGERSDERSSQDYLVERAVAHASTGCVWDLYHPYVAALCKPYIPALLYSLIICVSLFLLLVAVQTAAGNEMRGRQFRFTALQLRNGSVPLAGSGPRIAGLGVFKRYTLSWPCKAIN
jgi:hypothetical protein